MANFRDLVPSRMPDLEIEMYRQQMYYDTTISPYDRGNYGMQHQQALIVCPVCGSNRCAWWEHQILRDNAGEILKDMLRGVFKGEEYYDRGGGYREQEEYYQRMREQFYRPAPAKPAPEPKTEDIPHDVISTDIKGKPKKMLAAAKTSQ